MKGNECNFPKMMFSETESTEEDDLDSWFGSTYTLAQTAIPLDALDPNFILVFFSIWYVKI